MYVYWFSAEGAQHLTSMATLSLLQNYPVQRKKCSVSILPEEKREPAGEKCCHDYAEGSGGFPLPLHPVAGCSWSWCCYASSTTNPYAVDLKMFVQEKCCHFASASKKRTRMKKKKKKGKKASRLDCSWSAYLSEIWRNSD